MADTRWQRWLDLITPTTGRYRMENGDFINLADFAFTKQLEEISTQSILGNAYAATLRRTLAADASVDYVLLVPEGLRFYLHSRTQTVVGGALEISLLVNPDSGYTAAETVRGYNLDATIAEQSGASIVRTASPTTGGELRLQQILTPAGTGSNRSSATTTAVDAIPQYTSATPSVLRITNTGNASAEVLVNLVWAELDDPIA